MKTILCATDFSGAAEIAAMFSASLARAFDAKLILFHSFDPLPVLLPEPVVVGSIKATRNDMEDKLEDVRSLIDPMHTIDIEKKAVAGAVTYNMLNEVEERSPDLVICGMKGKGKGLRKIFGSTATELARKLTVPLIVVPEDAIYSGIKIMALANEDDLSAAYGQHSLDLLREIVKRFNTKLFLLRIAPNKTDEALELLHPPVNLLRLTRDLEPVYDCISGKDITDSLNHFVTRHKVDMLVLLSHHHTLLERIWNGNTGNKMIFHSQVPLLILPDHPSRN